MADELSQKQKANYNRTTSCEPDINLIEIRHPDLSQVLYMASFNEDIVSNGNNYIASRFDVEWPDKKSGGEKPVSKLVFDNIGRQMTQWVEQSCGGRCGEITFKLVNKGCPDEYAVDICMSITSICMDCFKVKITCEFEGLDKKAVTTIFDECHAPALF